MNELRGANKRLEEIMGTFGFALWPFAVPTRREIMNSSALPISRRNRLNGRPELICVGLDARSTAFNFILLSHSRRGTNSEFVIRQPASERVESQHPGSRLSRLSPRSFACSRVGTGEAPCRLLFPLGYFDK